MISMPASQRLHATKSGGNSSVSCLTVTFSPWKTRPAAMANAKPRIMRAEVSGVLMGVQGDPLQSRLFQSRDSAVLR